MKKHVARWLKCKGVGLAGTILTADEVYTIRYFYKAGEYTRYQLAKQYGCSWPTINSVVNYTQRFAKPLALL